MANLYESPSASGEPFVGAVIPMQELPAGRPPTPLQVFYGNLPQLTSMEMPDMLGTIAKETGGMALMDACKICAAMHEFRNGAVYGDYGKNFQLDRGV